MSSLRRVALLAFLCVACGATFQARVVAALDDDACFLDEDCGNPADGWRCNWQDGHPYTCFKLECNPDWTANCEGVQSHAQEMCDNYCFFNGYYGAVVQGVDCQNPPSYGECATYSVWCECY